MRIKDNGLGWAVYKDISGKVCDVVKVLGREGNFFYLRENDSTPRIAIPRNYVVPFNSFIGAANYFFNMSGELDRDSWAPIFVDRFLNYGIGEEALAFAEGH